MVRALPSRSAQESLAYLRLVPCSCGETEFQRTAAVRSEGDSTLKEYAGPCTRCGTRRHFVFAEAELPQASPPGQVVFGKAGTASALLDPGQWLLLANRAARAVTSGADDASAQLLMAYAIAALGEVLTFLPPAAGDFDAVPAECFVSATGRGVLAKEPPGTFQKARLVARLAAYRRLCNRMQGSNPDGIASAPAAAADPALVAPAMPPPGSLVRIDRVKKTLSFPTFVVGAGAREFVAAVRLATTRPSTPDGPAAEQLRPRELLPRRGTIMWTPIPLGAVHGYAAVLHLYGFDDDLQLAPLLAGEARHASGVVIAQGERAAHPHVLLPGLAEALRLDPRPVVVLGDEALAATWIGLGGPPPTQRLDPAGGALAAFRAIGKAMLLAL